MIGVNCVAPHLVSGLVEKLKASCDLPIGVYPNSGETYDPITKTWSGPKDGVRFGDYAYQWMEAGVSAIGGCCQTVADHIRQVTEARKRFLKRRMRQAKIKKGRRTYACSFYYVGIFIF